MYNPPHPQVFCALLPKAGEGNANIDMALEKAANILANLISDQHSRPLVLQAFKNSGEDEAAAAAASLAMLATKPELPRISEFAVIILGRSGYYTFTHDS
jgi:hypothetical protein